MKYIVLIVLAFFIDPGKIGKVNTAKEAAKRAYMRGEYQGAIDQYKLLMDSLGVKEDEIAMNLAHSYFELNDTLNATNTYLPLTNSSNPKLRSLANQQLGVLSNRQGKFEEALNYFKNSLKADPTNEEARFNYEIVKKKLEEKKKQEQQQNKDQQKDDQKKDDQQKDEQKQDQKDNKDQQNKDNKDQKKDDQQKKDQQKKDQEQKDKEQQEKENQQKEEQKKKEEEEQNKDKKDIPPSVSEKLKEMKMSEDKAKMVLEAMKNQEKQYLQQNKRKATQPKSKGKPDW